MNKLMSKLDETYKGEKIKAIDSLGKVLEKFVENKVPTEIRTVHKGLCSLIADLNVEIKKYPTQIWINGEGEWQKFGIGLEEVQLNPSVKKEVLGLILYIGNERNYISLKETEEIPLSFFEAKKNEMEQTFTELLNRNSEVILKSYEEMEKHIKQALNHMISEEVTEYPVRFISYLKVSGLLGGNVPVKPLDVQPKNIHFYANDEERRYSNEYLRLFSPSLRKKRLEKEMKTEVEEMLDEVDLNVRTKVLLGLLPTFQTKWKKYGMSKVQNLFNKKEVTKLKKLLYRLYPKQLVEEYIMNPKEEGIITKSYPFVIQHLFLQNKTYQQIEEVILKVKETGNYSITVEKRTPFHILSSNLPKEKNVYLLDITLTHPKEKKSARMTLVCDTNRYRRQKGTDEVYTEFEITCSEEQKNRMCKVAFPTAATCQKWMDAMEDVMEWLLEKETENEKE